MYGSNDSLFPSIWDVEAVGIGATNKEFLAPNYLTSYLKASQSYLLVYGFSFQRSNWNNPSDNGEP